MGKPSKASLSGHSGAGKPSKGSPRGPITRPNSSGPRRASEELLMTRTVAPGPIPAESVKGIKNKV